VGEWARVWPLEYIFKSFGAYFVRRRFREKLYHLVLEKYVQLISLQGVTQGIFLEGGLTRDGKVRPAKIGILDYIIGVQTNRRFTGELVFVPAAINYDWVLEDRTLIQEWKTGKEKSGFRDNIVSLARVMAKTPFLFVVNTFRYATGRLKHHGYASVSFGDPLTLSEFLNVQDTDIFTLERHNRLERVQELADSLLGRIASSMPVTPVSIVSTALRSCGHKGCTLEELTVQTGRLRHELRNSRSRMVLGKAFEGSIQAYSHLRSEEEERTKDLVAFEEDFLASEEARETLRVGLGILKRRRIVAVRDGVVTVNQSKLAFLEFYANSIGSLLPGR
jgi:glycerol-3-phosphate O-acyltransferase